VRIKLDENIPASLILPLEKLGHEVDSVPMEGLAGEPDNVVWNAVTAENRFFITQDLDFSDVRKYRPGSHEGILVVRLRQPGRTALSDRITAVFRSEDAPSMARCFVVLTERKIRIRRPETAS
jgi:predicted nuclease of predicted toxin-antitoxin system